MENYFFDNKVEEVEEKSKFLVFKIENEEFGLDIVNVVEIINIQPMTVLPDLPECICGVINLRNRICPIMDLRVRFRKERKQIDDRTCIIVVEFNDLFVGLIVDDIIEVADINNDMIRPVPKERTGFYNRFIGSVVDKGDNKMVFIIDCDALFVNEMSYIEEINSQE